MCCVLNQVLQLPLRELILVSNKSALLVPCLICISFRLSLIFDGWLKFITHFMSEVNASAKAILLQVGSWCCFMSWDVCFMSTGALIKRDESVVPWEICNAGSRIFV